MTGTIGGPEAKISLRMWSDSRSFYDIAKHIDMTPAIVLEIGQTPVPQKEDLTLYRAKRNYVSFGDITVDSGKDLTFRIDTLLEKISSSDLGSSLASNIIEATIWLAIFRGNVPWSHFYTETLKQRAANMNITLLIENYQKAGSNGAPLIEYI